MRCMKYNEEYRRARLVWLTELSVFTWIFEKTSRFHSSTAALTVSFKSHEGISVCLNMHAFSMEMKDIPTLDRTTVRLELLFQVNNAPTRSLSGPDASDMLPSIACWIG